MSPRAQLVIFIKLTSIYLIRDCLSLVHAELTDLKQREVRLVDVLMTGMFLAMNLCMVVNAEQLLLFAVCIHT